MVIDFSSSWVGVAGVVLVLVSFLIPSKKQEANRE